MSFELVNTFATLGTFVVIAATAMAAIVQLRHARSSNHIAAINELRETFETAHFQAAVHFVSTQLEIKLQDPAFRYQIATPSARTDDMLLHMAKINAVGNFFESMGLVVKTGLVDKRVVLEMWGGIVPLTWDRLAPVAAIARRRIGDSLWENFEYLTVLGQDWNAAHPNGNYPARVRRIDIKDEWLEADEQYSPALVPA